jgi:hypothetical protein
MLLTTTEIPIQGIKNDTLIPSHGLIITRVRSETTFLKPTGFWPEAVSSSLLAGERTT